MLPFDAAYWKKRSHYLLHKMSVTFYLKLASPQPRRRAVTTQLMCDCVPFIMAAAVIYAQQRAAEICHGFHMFYWFSIQAVLSPLVHRSTNAARLSRPKLKGLINLPGPRSVPAQQKNGDDHPDRGRPGRGRPRPHVPAVCAGEQHPRLQPPHLPRCYPGIHWTGKNRADALVFEHSAFPQGYFKHNPPYTHTSNPSVHSAKHISAVRFFFFLPCARWFAFVFIYPLAC